MADSSNSADNIAPPISIKKFRWSQVYESSEEELVNFLKSRNIDSERIDADSGSEQNGQSPKSTTIWCAEGSLLVKIGKNSTSLQPGDALRIDADTKYSIHPGMANCVYYLTS